VKIRDVGFSIGGNPGPGKRPRVEKTFSDAFDTAKRENKEQKARDMLAKIKAIAKKLTESGSVADIEDYRKNVKDYLAYVLENFYVVKQQHSIFTGKILTRVEIINKEVEALTAEFLEQQKNNFDMVKRINKITGLLVDLLK